MAKGKKQSDGKQRVELRIDPELYKLIESKASRAGVSINQLVQGVLWWAMPRAVMAKGFNDETGESGTLVFLGRVESDGTAVVDFTGDDAPPVIFALDFSERRAVVSGTNKRGEQ